MKTMNSIITLLLLVTVFAVPGCGKKKSKKTNDLYYNGQNGAFDPYYWQNGQQGAQYYDQNYCVTPGCFSYVQDVWYNNQPYYECMYYGQPVYVPQCNYGNGIHLGGSYTGSNFQIGGSIFLGQDNCNYRYY